MPGTRAAIWSGKVDALTRRGLVNAIWFRLQMRKMVVCGIVCCAVGALLWGVIGPTIISGMDGSTIHWGKSQRVAYVSVGAGMVIGIGLALIVIGAVRRNN